MKVFAISGWKGSGKDTCSDYLKDNYGFKGHSFAKPLKDMVAKQYGIAREILDDPDKKEIPLLQYPLRPGDEFSMMISGFMLNEFRDKDGNVAKETAQLHSGELYWTPRALMILEGSVKRSVTSSHWVKNVVADIEASKDRELHLITDLRYNTEISQLKEKFGNALYTLRIQRYANVSSIDPSERDLDNYNFDCILENSGSLDDLYTDLDQLMLLEEIKKVK